MWSYIVRGFLRVRGDRGAYKIHLRSGNILMEPNDQYLSIVPGPPRSGRRRKVFLLAADGKITDPTIRAQLERP
jgi:hypothetical protein